MTQPSESIALQDSFAKKLQLLQTENNTLRQEREAFEGNIRRYVETISQLDDQLSSLKQKNENLTQINRQSSIKCRKLELDLERAHDQYKTLYHYVHMEEKRSQRNLVIKEMELNNQLNEIQYDGYSKMILNLKETINGKNQAILDMNSENTKLKQKLLQCTYEYQEQIAQLKEEVIELKSSQCNNQSKKDSMIEQHAFEVVSIVKMECLQKQLAMVDTEYSKLSKQLIQCKSQLSYFKQEAEWLKITLENNNSEKEVAMDFSEVRNILEENITLKKRLEQQSFKFNILLKNNPSLLSQIEEIDLSANVDDIQEQCSQLKQTLTLKENQIIKLKASNVESTKSKNAKEEELIKFKTTTVKTIDKLKTLLKKYLPCANLYGYLDFGLDQEECKFVEENGADISKQFEKVSNYLLQKTSEARRLEETLKTLTETIKEQETQLSEERKRNEKLEAENKKMVASLETLTDQWNNWAQNQPLHFREQSPLFERQQNQEDSPDKKRDLYPEMNQEESLTKLDSICGLAASLQKDRVTLLQCIRNKDTIIAEANAELNVLRNSCRPKVFSFSSGFILNQESQPQLILNSVQKSNSDQLLKQQIQLYNKLKTQISSMGQLYQNEIYLVEEEHSRKFKDLNMKFTKLMTDNRELQKKYQRLEKMYEEGLEKRSEKGSKKAESVYSENISGIQFEDNAPKDDKNMITETTIQIINDLLKKYQKQFSRFSSLYQSELAKAKQLKKNTLEEVDRRSFGDFLHSKMRLIQAIIEQKSETIKILENELQEKDWIAQNEREKFQKAEHLSEQRLADLEVRLNQTSEDLSILQKKGIQILNSGTSIEGVSSKSMSFILVSVAAKNRQISQLRDALDENEEKVAQLTQLVNNLEGKLQSQQSELEMEEFRQFKKLIEDGELAFVLEKASDLLQARKQREGLVQ